MFNLLPQLNENIILIPENVIIGAKFKSQPSDEINQSETNLGDILDVRRVVAANGDQIPSQLQENQCR